MTPAKKKGQGAGGGGPGGGRRKAAAKKAGKGRAPGLGRSTVAPREEAYLKSLVQDRADDEAVQIVSFFLGSTEYAFEVFDAVEVLKPSEVTEVPQVPAFIKGVLSVRGEMVPVVDLRGRLGIDPEPVGQGAAGRILVAGSDDLRAGFLVDRMGAVKDVKTRSIKPATARKGFLKGSIRSGGAKIDILDITRLLDI